VRIISIFELSHSYLRTRNFTASVLRDGANIILCVKSIPHRRKRFDYLRSANRLPNAGFSLSIGIMAVVLLGSTTQQTGVEQKPLLSVKSNTTGEIHFEARGVTIEEALRAIAAKVGFEVEIEPGIKRAPVNLTVPSASVEVILRQVLRGRNYSLVYDEDGLSRVIVLPPPPTPKPPRALRRRRR